MAFLLKFSFGNNWNRVQQKGENSFSNTQSRMLKKKKKNEGYMPFLVSMKHAYIY